jgi:transketolase
VRKVCINSVHALAKSDERVIFIGSDLGPDVLAEMKSEMPSRFFMEGVSEQHIIGMAAGLAMEGFIPYLNTIATFLTRRCLEQLVIDICLHHLPVRLLASGGGAVYAPLGPTHIAIDDIALLRTMPNMAIVAPCDADEMGRLMEASLHWPGPLYVRIAKGGDPIVSKPDAGFQIGKGIVLKEGKDILLVTTGVTAQVALDAAGLLSSKGIDPTVLHLHTIKPMDHELLHRLARVAKTVVTVEEHTLVGGLGSAVLESLVDAGIHGIPIRRVGFPDVFTEELGSQAAIMDHYGISSEKLAQTVLEMTKASR